MDDLISRQVALDELAENKEMINAVLDSLTLDYNTRKNLDQRRSQVDEDIETIKELQTIEPKHGEWHKFDNTYYRCSNCGGWLKYDSRSLEYLKIDYKYCPKCGARMDGSKE